MFKDNGFLAVERLTSDEEIAWLRQIFEFTFDPANAGTPFAPVDRSGQRAEGEASRLSQAFFPEMHFPEDPRLRLPAQCPALRRRPARCRRRAAVELGTHDPQAPGGREVPWHQDRAYWLPELDYLALGVWLPLQDVTVEMGAMQFIPGSHKAGLRRHRHQEDPIHNLLTVDEIVDRAAAVPCPLKAGGATFHHSGTLHFTASNTTQQYRLAFPMEFQLAPSAARSRRSCRGSTSTGPERARGRSTTSPTARSSRSDLPPDR